LIKRDALGVYTVAEGYVWPLERYNRRIQKVLSPTNLGYNYWQKHYCSVSRSLLGVL